MFGISDKTFYINMQGEDTYAIDTETGDFNYISCTVESALYLKMYIVVQLEDDTYVYDVFFLENRNYVFNSFFHEKEGKKIKKICYMQVCNLENKKGFITFKQMRFLQMPEFPAEPVYIESKKIIAGVDIKKGTALGFLSSKQYEVREVDDAGGGKRAVFERTGDFDAAKNANLINTYDRGRLLQQSWYGDDRSPYQIGISFGNLWRYNPVQSGDRFNNVGRIIEYARTDKSLYLKVRPLDWAKNNYVTDSYMETHYRFEHGVLKVSNRFIDFSMLNHYRNGMGRQEMPSFHPVASLKNYVYPTKKNKFVSKSDLGFWGETDNYKKTLFRIESCWSGWFNDEHYGIALYTPFITKHHAGRYMAGEAYDGPASQAKPVNYLAGIKNFDIDCLQPIEYTYYISVGNIKDIQSDFKKIVPKENTFLSEIDDD